MKPAPFDYLRPASVEDAVSQLASYGGVAQGLGIVLLEHHRYDESGHLETPSPISVAGLKGHAA